MGVRVGAPRRHAPHGRGRWPYECLASRSAVNSCDVCACVHTGVVIVIRSGIRQSSASVGTALLPVIITQLLS